jgi:hypothetical protein
VHSSAISAKGEFGLINENGLSLAPSSREKVANHVLGSMTLPIGHLILSNRRT